MLEHQIDAPYFYWAFYTMTAICIAFYVALFYIGVQFIRGTTNLVRLLVLVLVCEALYFFAVGSFWHSQEYGMSIAAATGVANGGLVVQVVSGFVVWAPLITFFASRGLNRTADGATVPQPLPTSRS